MPETTLLDIRDLRVYYKTTRGNYKVVDGASFKVLPNEVIGIAGESGCGKSTLVEAILRLIVPPGHIESGEAVSPLLTEGVTGNADLLSLGEEEFRQLRWTRISYIPQGSMNSLNPVMKVEDQIIDAIQTHEPMPKDQAQKRVAELLDIVGLSPQVSKLYPHELSGGMKQRVIIAASIALKPRLIIADEPTTALDVTIQKLVLQTLMRVRKRLNCTIMVVSHDMPVHAQISDRLVIMYAGKVMEVGTCDLIFNAPLHPYSQGLIATIPSIKKERVRLAGIPGVSPSPSEWPSGCRFHPRCEQVIDVCRSVEPKLREVQPGRFVACHLYE
ncbi:MAG: ABC transporter ATP-binding protein [Anaerolineaceae bacterium]|nr:ABC transporter ATP-binding protein [Anaerolineaceae bacterium]